MLFGATFILFPFCFFSCNESGVEVVNNYVRPAIEAIFVQNFKQVMQSYYFTSFSSCVFTGWLMNWSVPGIRGFPVGPFWMRVVVYAAKGFECACRIFLKRSTRQVPNVSPER